jgi:hypothetical protein
MMAGILCMPENLPDRFELLASAYDAERAKLLDP